ncbi:PREDICTED: protein DGS1, mitochondrial [Tarenaya hassleriana]|uniref:protein DGS1, mitochondrial n=1 Tax=Tarenaya hassleriana TaxID=28532 RepID=UPI00053C5968|nr:PREDICTED: protein DGS1, mitochondrial [Tarenaya hassleriana]XP_010519827.1 PREDICTED: protein DGS1, mitochondrial [Tarenaya hassleriana]
MNSDFLPLRIPMESQPQATEQSSSPPPANSETLVSFYSYYLWNRFASLIPSSGFNFLGKFSNKYRQTNTRRRRQHFLPLPLPSDYPDSYAASSEISRIYDVLADIMAYFLSNLHDIQKSLQFWQSRVEDSDARKAYFMIFERGPMAFFDETVKFVHKSLGEGFATRHLCQSASSHMSERIRVLMELRCALASFLAQLYVEMDKCGTDSLKNPEKSLTSLLAIINGLFLNLEASIRHLHAERESNSPVDGSCSMPLVFDNIPEVNQEGSQWTDCELKDAINVIYKNLEKLESYLSFTVGKHRKPKKITLYWVRYTCGAVGFGALSIWLLRHSRLMGSSDIDNWIRDAKEATTIFFSDHVEQPLLAIRDELFDTFRKRHKGVMEIEEVQLTQDSLHRMLMNFCEQTSREKHPENASDQQMLEVVMNRYEKELVHPIHNLLGGELARALLIQVQKLKLDIETAMLELDQILRANEINFAILAALPAFFLSLIMFTLFRTWLKKDSRAVGRGRIARIHRRLLVIEIEKRIMEHQSCVEQGREKDAECMFGLVIYNLDRLYRVVERHARATGEWDLLKQELIELGNPQLPSSYKLGVTRRLVGVYDCLLPPLKRQ